MATRETALDEAVQKLQFDAERDSAEEIAAIGRAIVKIKVFGVGGGGGSVLRRLAESNPKDVDLIAVNTDANALGLLDGEQITRIQIGENLTKGRGTGGKVAISEQATLSDKDRLGSVMRGSDMIFITAGMGGGTGTGAAPLIAKFAKEQNILTVGVVTLPFSFEGPRKKRIAEDGILKMQSYLDALVVIKNDNLMKLRENKKLSLVEAFKSADTVLRQAISCVVELILTTGFINVDFADVTTILQQSQSCDAMLGIGQSDKNAVEAVEKAITSPLIDRSLKGARGIILNITGDESLTLYEINEAAEFIGEQTAGDVNIIFGTVINPKMDGIVQATVIATDFVDSIALKSLRADVPISNVKMPGFNFNMPKVETPNNRNDFGVIPAFGLTNRRDD